MKISVWLGTIVGLVLITISFGQDDGKTYCQNLIQCYQEAQQLYESCQKQKPANASSSTNKKAGNCKAALSEKQTQLKEKNNQHRQQTIDCLKSRVNEAMPVPAKKSAKCQSGGPSPAGDGTSGRSKRQSSNVTTTTTTETDSSKGNGRGNGGGKGGGGGKGKGKGQGKGNPCMKQVQQKAKQCKQTAPCCSEVAYCHLKFELSDLHDQTRQLQLDILEQKRQCQKEQQKSQSVSSATKGQSGNNVQRDDPFEDDDDDEDDEE